MRPRPGRALVALLLAATPGCATAVLWHGDARPGRWGPWSGATGGRAWCVDEGDALAAADADAAWGGWPAPAPIDTASRGRARGPHYVVELTYREGRRTNAWVEGPSDGDGPPAGRWVGAVAAPGSGRQVALRTVRATGDGRAAEVQVVDGDVAFVISCSGGVWLEGSKASAARVLLTPLALAWDVGTSPIQLLLWALLR